MQVSSSKLIEFWDNVAAVVAYSDKGMIATRKEGAVELVSADGVIELTDDHFIKYGGTIRWTI